MATLMDQQPPVNPMEDAMQWMRDSTLATAFMGLAGYPMGCGFSLFGSMISAETSAQTMGTVDFFKYTFRSAHSLGCSFAYFGFLFGGIEIALEKRRGKKDIWNPTASGAVIAGWYGWREFRPKSLGLVGGIVGGGIASVIFEYLMGSVGWGQK